MLSWVQQLKYVQSVTKAVMIKVSHEVRQVGDNEVMDANIEKWKRALLEIFGELDLLKKKETRC